MCTNVMKFQGIFRQSSLKIVGVLNGALDYFCTQILHYFHLRVRRQHSLRLNEYYLRFVRFINIADK